MNSASEMAENMSNISTAKSDFITTCIFLDDTPDNLIISKTKKQYSSLKEVYLKGILKIDLVIETLTFETAILTVYQFIKMYNTRSKIATSFIKSIFRLKKITTICTRITISSAQCAFSSAPAHWTALHVDECFVLSASRSSSPVLSVTRRHSTVAEAF